MYPLFPDVPASIVELGCFRIGRVLISECFFVGFSSRFTVWTGGFGVATVGLDWFFERLGNEIDSITGYVSDVGKCVLDAGMHGG